MSQKTLFLVSGVYFLLNGAIQCSAIFIPLLGSFLGGTDSQIGMIGASYGAAFLLASLYSGRMSDQRGKLSFVHFGLVLCTVAFASQLLANSLITLAVLRAFVGLALGVTTAALVAYAFESGADMGKFSSFSSLGWIGGASAATMLSDFDILFTASSIFCALAMCMSIFLTKPANEILSPTNTNIRLGTVIKMGFPIYLSVFLRHLGATSVFIILPLYFISLGLDRFWVGALWVINFIVQFIVMRFLDRFEPRKVFAFGQIMSIGVFVGYALVHSLAPLFLIQCMLGIAWACLYVGALLLVLQIGQERGTASGIFQATLNLCNAIGPLIGGIIAQYWGYRGVMIFAAILGIGGFLVAVPQSRAALPKRDTLKETPAIK